MHGCALEGGFVLRLTYLLLLAFLLFFVALQPAPANAAEPPLPEYRLRLYHTHTNERINIVYRRGDEYVPEAVNRLDQFLRDHRTGDVRQLDERLFDLLHDLTQVVGRAGAEINIVCGYRTPWSNEFLRSTTSGVAAHSLHMEGEAIDIRIPGIPTTALRNAALSLHRGGGWFLSRVSVRACGRWPGSALVAL